MSFSRLRLETTSLFNYMKYEVIAPRFTELTTSDSLVYTAATSSYRIITGVEPFPFSNGRGIVFFNDYEVGDRIYVDTTQEQTNKVAVTGASVYTINYLAGEIKNPNTIPTSVQFYWNYISVIPGWPGREPPPLPIVSISIDSNRKEGFQLGGGTRNIRKIYFDIFATSDTERDDISDVVHTALFSRSISIKNFGEGNYLNYNGTYNNDLVHPLAIQGQMNFIDVDHRNIYMNNDWDDLNRYRSVVTGTYESFVG